MSNKVLEWKEKSHFSSYKSDMALLTIMNIVRESKVQRIDEDKVWKRILEHRWNTLFLNVNSRLNEKEIMETIHKTAQDLNLINGSNVWNWIPEEDLKFGMQLYLVLLVCPRTLIETAKLAVMFESLITNENLNTVVAATMHNIQPRAGDNIKDFTAINMWYQRLDEKYNFSLVDAILPLMTTDDMKQMEKLTPPFELENNGTGLHNTSSIAGKSLILKYISLLKEETLFW